tara:strand:+ start:3421 stop:3879 length:459 start_codon:yes stop_codon:yes gene_type:complete
MEVKDIVKEAVTIGEEASFKDAIALMINEKTNSLLVTDGDGVLIGEVTVSDLLEAIVPEYLSGDSVAAHFATGAMFDEAVEHAAEKQVQFFMTTDISPVQETESAMAVAANAIAHRRVRIPVVDANGKPVGIISRRGLKHIIGNALHITDEK